MILSRLKDKMKDAKVRPEDLAAKTGLSIETVKNARRGKNVSLLTANVIARFMHIAKEDLA